LIEHKTKKWSGIIEFEKDGNYFTAWVTEDNLKDEPSEIAERVARVKFAKELNDEKYVLPVIVVEVYH
jgi:hypothetical protein